MKIFLLTSLLVLIGVVISISPSVAGELKEIDGKELESMMSDAKKIVIVDVREPEEFSGGHIKGASNIPYDSAKPRIFKELFPGDRIVFVCHGGPMGHELGTLLARNSYQNVYNLKGGMKKWKGEIVR